MLQGSGTITIYQIAADFVGKYNDWGGFQYSGSISDLYNLNYFRGRPRYVGGGGPYNDGGGSSHSPGNFSGGQINMSDFYNTEGNCNCDCNCACDCQWNCDCNCADCNWDCNCS